MITAGVGRWVALVGLWWQAGVGGLAVMASIAVRSGLSCHSRAAGAGAAESAPVRDVLFLCFLTYFYLHYVCTGCLKKVPPFDWK